jgi:hypothetical protein
MSCLSETDPFWRGSLRIYNNNDGMDGLAISENRESRLNMLTHLENAVLIMLFQTGRPGRH